MIIACRDIQKAELAAREITSETNNLVSTIKLDLASLSSVKHAAQLLKDQQPKIHLLINNAGTNFTSYILNISILSLKS